MSPTSRTLMFAAMVMIVAAGPSAAQSFGLPPGPALPTPSSSASGLALAPKVAFDIVKLRRMSDKGVLQLEFTVTNRSDLPANLRELGLANNFWLEGIKLVDFANKRRYAMGTSEGTCLCTSFGSSDADRVKPGETKTYWAWFASPPADVRDMSVLLPNRAPILNVQVQ